LSGLQLLLPAGSKAERKEYQDFSADLQACDELQKNFLILKKVFLMCWSMFKIEQTFFLSLGEHLST